MNKIIITVLGKDRPGIIASVSKSLYQMDCNLQNVNQMILQNQFAGFFIVDHPADLTMDSIHQQLEKDLDGQNLKIHADVVENKVNGNNKSDEEIFLFTTIGPDQKGLVARFTEIIASYNVNVTNLTAIFKGGDEPTANIMSYQIVITSDTDQAGLFKSLRQKAAELGLDISIQHKNIFETINKI
ncbi:MAG: amino acid-binding protein [Desulfamplus sp.]|nr:amino acid-binding protein [Desulfamplus sp.]MBF0258786.1 amino acid-binding protein [Desulfamplus sp.]